MRTQCQDPKATLVRALIFKRLLCPPSTRKELTTNSLRIKSKITKKQNKMCYNLLQMQAIQLSRFLLRLSLSQEVCRVLLVSKLIMTARQHYNRYQNRSQSFFKQAIYSEHQPQKNTQQQKISRLKLYRRKLCGSRIN